MLYKRICLQMIQDRPHLYDQLLKKRMLLPAMEKYATELMDLHDERKTQLRQVRPETSESQLANEALELALNDLQLDLPSESEPDETETFPLDQAMAFISRHTPPA